MVCQGLYDSRLANSICAGESNFCFGMRKVATGTRGDSFQYRMSGQFWMRSPQTNALGLNYDDARRTQVGFRSDWTTRRGLLTLHHTRRGDDSAVHLGDLAEGPDGAWRSLAPHLCGADTYDVVITIGAEELVLAWRVRGPSKDYLMVRRYA